MPTLTTSVTTAQPTVKTNDYFDGEFDALLELPPKSQDGDYWRGYLKKVIETGNTPF